MNYMSEIWFERVLFWENILLYFVNFVKILRRQVDLVQRVEFRFILSSNANNSNGLQQSRVLFWVSVLAKKMLVWSILEIHGADKHCRLCNRIDKAQDYMECKWLVTIDLFRSLTAESYK